MCGSDALAVVAKCCVVTSADAVGAVSRAALSVAAAAVAQATASVARLRRLMRCLLCRVGNGCQLPRSGGGRLSRGRMSSLLVPRLHRLRPPPRPGFRDG